MHSDLIDQATTYNADADGVIGDEPPSSKIVKKEKKRTADEYDDGKQAVSTENTSQAQRPNSFHFLRMIFWHSDCSFWFYLTPLSRNFLNTRFRV
jgi:hypothetical protein